MSVDPIVFEMQDKKGVPAPPARLVIPKKT
jgi:hypothetical protein